MGTQPSGHSVDGAHFEVVRPRETGCRYRGSVSVELPTLKSGEMQLYSPSSAWICTSTDNDSVECTDIDKCRYRRKR